MSDSRPSTQDQRRLTSANRFLTIIGSSYGLDVALLAAFASIGTVSLTAPILHAMAGLSHVLIFGAINRSRWFARLSDSQITFFQMLSGLITHLAMAALFPAVGGLMLLPLFLVLGFSALTMTARQTWPILVCALACLAFLVIGLQSRPAFPVDNLSERLLTLTFFTICLGRSMLLGTIGSEYRTRLAGRNEEMKASIAEVHRLATTDDLTGCLNRRSIMKQLDAEFNRAGRSGQPVCLVMTDLDHFKQINDRFGHAAGDQVLRDFVAVAIQTLRVSDAIGRVGGEEFLIILPDSTLAAGLIAMQRLRAAMAAHRWLPLPEHYPVTVSIGIAQRIDNESLVTWMERADQAMYDAKAGGRDRIQAASVSRYPRELTAGHAPVA